MKKLLLTLGSTVTIAAPLATVIACDQETGLTVSAKDGILTINGFRCPASDQEAEDYQIFMALIGDRINAVAGHEEITSVKLSGHIDGIVDNKIVSTKVDSTLSIADIPEMELDNLQEAISNMPEDGVFPPAALVFEKLVKMALGEL